MTATRRIPRDAGIVQRAARTALHNALPKTFPTKNATTTRSGDDGGQNGCVRKSGLILGSIRIALNDSVGSWTRRTENRASGQNCVKEVI